MTTAQEAQREEPWSLDLASPQFIDAAARRLIGFEIEISEMRGKCVLSQQRTEVDRRSLIEHLSQQPSGMARDVAALIEP